MNGAPGSRSPASADHPLERVREEAERKYILSILNVTKGRRAEAARLLGISRNTPWEKVKRLSLS